MPESPPRRSAIDTLVARDRTAIFWFLMAVVTAAVCVWYVDLMSKTYALRPPFVVMDTAGSYYVPPGVTYEDPRMDPMHLQLTEMATETLLSRNSDGILFPEREGLLFEKAAQLKMKKYLREEEGYFSRQNATQTFDIDRITFEPKRQSTTVTTHVYGSYHRVSYLDGEEQRDSYSFKLSIGWRRNDALVNNRAYPSLVADFMFSGVVPLIESAEAPAPIKK